jgi:methyl-accepting chemotaxis protein
MTPAHPAPTPTRNVHNAPAGPASGGRGIKLRLAHKLILLFLAFAIVPLVATSTINARASGEVEEILSSRTKTMASTRADTIDGILFELYGDAQSFGMNEVVLDRANWYKTEEQGNRVVAAMNKYVSLDDRYFLTIFVDLAGKVVAVNSKDVSGKPIDSTYLYKKSFQDAAWFKAVSQGAFTTKQPYATPDNQKATGTYVEDAAIDADVKTAVHGSDGYSMGFAAPVFGADGKVVGYWLNRAKFSLVESVVAHFYKEQKAGGRPGTAITILNGRGEVLLDHDPSTRGTDGVVRDPNVILKPADKATDPVVRDVLDGKSGNVRHAGPKGQDLLSGYVRSRGASGFPGLNWSYIVRVPREQAVGALIAQDRALLLVYGLAFALVLVVGYFVARRVAAPVVAMTSAAQALSLGNVERSITHQSGDELGELADALRGVFDFTRNVAASVNGIANGDLDVAVTKRSDADVLSESVLRAKASLRGVIHEVDTLIDAARTGRLEIRGNPDGQAGVYRNLTVGMNDVMSAFGGPLADMRAVVEKVAERDLTVRMREDYSGDYAAVAAAMNRALGNVETTLAGMSSASDRVAVAASEISSGNQSLSQAATEQASTLEEVTSSLQEITAMSKQNAGNAQQARAMALGASEGADRGTRSMQQLSEAVTLIRKQADQTARIVKTIDEIAFQTNLLALNAAVEAARAGDSGKGFAVVAEEVRNLAMRSAEAAKTTSALIEESVKSSEQGVRLNAEVAAHFDEITSKVKKVVEVMGEIATASEHQSRGVSQINSAVDEMSRVTQHNAATTEESAAAAEELAAQATSVREMVGAFRANDEGSGRAGASGRGSRAGKARGHLRSVPPLPMSAARR